MLWVGEYRFAGPRLDDLSLPHDRDAIAEKTNDREIVTDEYGGQAKFHFGFAEEIENLRLDGYVERRGRLIGQYQRRPKNDGARDRYALTLAPAQLMGKAGDERLQEVLPGRGPRRFSSIAFTAIADALWTSSGAERIAPILCRGLKEDAGSWNIA